MQGSIVHLLVKNVAALALKRYALGIASIYSLLYLNPVSLRILPTLGPVAGQGRAEVVLGRSGRATQIPIGARSVHLVEESGAWRSRPPAADPEGGALVRKVRGAGL